MTKIIVASAFLITCAAITAGAQEVVGQNAPQTPVTKPIFNFKHNKTGKYEHSCDKWGADNPRRTEDGSSTCDWSTFRNNLKNAEFVRTSLTGGISPVSAGMKAAPSVTTNSSSGAQASSQGK